MKPRALDHEATICVYLLDHFGGDVYSWDVSISLPEQNDRLVGCFQNNRLPLAGTAMPVQIYRYLESSSPELGFYFGWHVFRETSAAAPPSAQLGRVSEASSAHSTGTGETGKRGRAQSPQPSASRQRSEGSTRGVGSGNEETVTKTLMQYMCKGLLWPLAVVMFVRKAGARHNRRACCYRYRTTFNRKKILILTASCLPGPPD